MKTSLKDTLNIIFRYFRHLMIFTVAVILVGWGYGAVATKLYKSNAKILIRLGTEQSATNPFIGSMSNIYITRRNQELKNELEILTSDWVITESAKEIVRTGRQNIFKYNGKLKIVYTMIDQIKSYLSLPPRQDLSVVEIKSYLSANFKTSALFDSDMLELSFNFPDPEQARQILSVIIEQFIKHHIQAYTSVKELNFLSEELEVSRKNYERLLDDLNRFTTQHGVFNDQQQLDLVMEKKRDLERVLAEMKANYENHGQKLQRLKTLQEPLNPYETFNTSLILNKTRENLKNKLNEAQIEKQNLLTRYQDDSRFIKDINREIIQLEKLLASEPRRVVDQEDSRKNPIYESLLTDILTLDSDVIGEKAKIDSIELELRSVKDELNNFTLHNKEFQVLTIEVEFAKKTYEKVFDGYLDTKLKSLISKQEITNISVIEQPSLNFLPDSPNKKKLAIITFTVIVAGNIFLLIFFTVIDTSVTNPSEIPKVLGIPVIGYLPLVKLSSTGSRSFLWLYQKQIRLFQNLYTNLVLKDVPGKIFLIAKSRHGEGGTTICYNLGVFMSIYQSKRVAVVDFDGDNTITKNIDGKVRLDTNFEKIDFPHFTLFKFAAETDDDTKKIQDNFYILKTLKSEYDFILVNISPVSDSPDLVFLQRYIDKVILVVEAEKTNSLIVKYNLSIMKEFAFGNISVLLNKRHFYIPGFLYRFL